MDDGSPGPAGGSRQRLRHQKSRAAAEPWARMGRGADMVQARYRRAVVDGIAERAPEEELVDAAEAAVGIAADEIDVQRFEVGRRIHFAGDDAVVEILDVRRHDRLDAVGILLAYLFGPPSVCRRRDL